MSMAPSCKANGVSLGEATATRGGAGGGGGMIVSLAQAAQLLQDGQLTLCTRLIEEATPEKRRELLGQRDSAGRGLLHWASVKGGERLAELALADGALPVDCPDDQSWTPLMLATSAGHLAVARLLLGAGADPNAVNATGQASLHYAASKNRVELSRALLAAGAAARGGAAGVTPLHRSCAQGHTEVTRLLLGNGAPVGAADSEGNTPLHFACEEGRMDDARLLVESGGSLSQQNRDKKTPLDLVQASADRRQLELFAQNANR